MKHEDIKWIKENSFAVLPNSTLAEQTEILMNYLGSPDSDLREGALDILYTWIMEARYSDDKLLSLGDRLAQNLHVGIGEQNTDTVFLRAFSALILEAIIDFEDKCALKDIENREAFMSKEQVLAYLDKSIQYYQKERDTRGFVTINGWAHSIAHGADLFNTFATHRLMGKHELTRILDLFKFKITEPIEEVYTSKEDVRISVAVYSIFMRKLLSLDEMCHWFQSVADIYLEKRWFKYAQKIPFRNGILNTRMFFQSFYLMIKI